MSEAGKFTLYYIGGASLVGQFVLLYLQMRAYIRNHHPSFVLLIASSVFGLVGICVTYIPFVWPSLLSSYVVIGWVTAGFLTLQLVATTWGAAWLFNSYNSLAQRSGT